MLDFSCDYNVGTAPEILRALTDINNDHEKTYGWDKYCDSAKEKIRKETGNPDAEIWFMTGGTQTNQIALSHLIKSYEGILSAKTGHIAVHEAGAVEMTGHKVIEINAHSDGRIDIEAMKKWLETYYADPVYEHMVTPGAVYITHPTEYGGLYSLDELKAIRELCDRYNMKLYLDGARLAYGLSSDGSDITMKDLGRYCDAFYIGGTKCGALLGEALVFRTPQSRFFTHRKRHGGLLAKGWILGIQFDTLFTDGLYYKLGKNAFNRAMQIKAGLKELGYEFYSDSKTNQQFILLSDEKLEQISKDITTDYWGKQGDKNIIRICTSWKTTEEEVAELLIRFQ